MLARRAIEGPCVPPDAANPRPERRSDDGQTIFTGSDESEKNALTWRFAWSYGDSNPGPLACHQQAARPPASIGAGHRPHRCVEVRRNPGALRYFPAVLSGRPHESRDVAVLPSVPSPRIPPSRLAK